MQLLKNISQAIIGTALLVSPMITPANAAQRNGEIAQDFKLTSASGKTVQLSQYRGKIVVLEWHNPGCPFVQKHYDSGNMQKAQKFAQDNGVVWLTINSGGKGRQGYMTGSEARKLIADQHIRSSEYLLDARGLVGKAYGARATPHMYIIDQSGKLVYQGGIDDKPTARIADISSARNHVTAALSEMIANRKVSVAQSRPYGCSIKYAG